MSTVWQELDHATILHGIEEILGEKLSNLMLRRNSYINRVYELEKHDSRERVIVKFYRPGRWTEEMILIEHQFLQDLAKGEVPVIPPINLNGRTLFYLKGIAFEIMPKKGGRALDEFDQDAWEQLGRLLARIHLIGAGHKQADRLVLRPGRATREHLKVLAEHDFLLPDFRDSFFTTVEKLIATADPIFSDQEYILIHGDCHKGNLLHRPGEGIYIVDFDDICIGPPVQDLWMLLPDKVEKSELELSWFLKGYETFRPFALNSLNLVPYLRAMRIVHYAAWLAVQSREPDFGVHFPHAGGKRYWNDLIRELQEILYGEVG